MNNQKIAIIGGGICGLYLGWKLSEGGFNVTIFEAKKEIGKKVCSGLFSERILEFFPQSRQLIKNQINFSRIYFPKRTIKVSFSKPFFVMSHFDLDKLAASLAENAGAKIILGRGVYFLPKGFDKIIGCDGANSSIRKSLNLSAPKFRLGIQGFVKKKSFLDFVEIWPCQEGFIWKIPRGNEIEYGIISKPVKAKKIFSSFLKKNNIPIERTKAKIIPQGLIIPSHNAITLCGDAAGLTKPWSGGGVIWSLTAADLLLKNFPNFLSYRRVLQRFFIPKIAFSKTLTKLVYFLGFNLPWLLPRNTKIESDFLF